jgi:hypothetical protein
MTSSRGAFECCWERVFDMDGNWDAHTALDQDIRFSYLRTTRCRIYSDLKLEDLDQTQI